MTTTKTTTTAKKRSTRKAKTTPTPEERYLKLQECAYLKAEADGFQKNSVEYWLAAEKEVGY